MNILSTLRKKKIGKTDDYHREGNSDAELWKEFESGSNDAFIKLYERHSTRLAIFLQRFLTIERETDDVFQESWMRLFQLRDKVHVQNVGVMLLRIARNLALNLIKKKTEMLGTLDESFPSDEAIASGVESEDAVRALRKAVAILSPSLREVFILREYEELEYEEIATITETSVKATRMRYYRALEEIRSSLRTWLGINEKENPFDHI